MGLLKVSSCCCYDLRTGSSIIAVLGLIFATVYTIAGAAGLAIYVPQVPTYIGNELIILFSIIVVAGAVALVFYALLVHGTSKNHPGFTNAWIIYQCILLGLGIIGMAITFIFTRNIINCIGQVIGLSLQLYFLSVVRSYRSQLIQKSQEEKPKISDKEFSNKLSGIDQLPTYHQASLQV